MEKHHAAGRKTGGAHHQPQTGGGEPVSAFHGRKKLAGILYAVERYGTDGFAAGRIYPAAASGKTTEKRAALFHHQIYLHFGAAYLELVDYCKRNNMESGAIFRSQRGTNIHRITINAAMKQLCQMADVAPEKVNPRCLLRLYEQTQNQLQDNVSMLLMQYYDKLLEAEEMMTGWETNEDPISAEEKSAAGQ